MKKLDIFFFFIIIFFIGIINVFAQDNVYSINKNDNEKFYYVIDTYNTKEEKDGNLLIGTFLKEEIEYNDQTFNNDQIMAIKYDDLGNIIWSYRYGKTAQDMITTVTYIYDENGKINGYGIIIPTSYNVEEENLQGTTILKLSLDGKLLEEKPITEDHQTIEKIILANQNKTDGYIAVGYQKENNNKEKALLIRYDRDFNVLWTKDFSKEDNNEINYQDIEVIKKDNNVVGYAVIKEITNIENKKEKSIIAFNLDGEEDSLWNIPLEYENSFLEEANNGVLVYGITKDVKLEKGEASYYINNYLDGEEKWESIGETPTLKTSKIKMIPRFKEGSINEYILMVQSNDNTNTEIIKIDSEGTFIKKIKKITTEYYDIESFNVRNNTIFIAGQINCPKDDTCDYDTNSLFLVSDEDKVIEVEDKDSKNILIVITIIVLLGILIPFIRNKRKKLLR